MALLIGTVLAGFLLGRAIRWSGRALAAIEKLVTVGLMVLLGAMGTKIGLDDGIWANLDRLGLEALVITLAAIGGSLLGVRTFRLLFARSGGLDRGRDLQL